VATSTIMAKEDFRERLTALSRHQKRIALVTGIAAAATILLAILLPPTYQSTATILIEQQEIPQDLVRSTITSFADQRVQVISQRVMTSQNLLQIIERYDLYPKIRKTKPREYLLKQMKDDVRMAMISADVIDPRSGRPTRANIAFSVSYANRSPELAYKVANELTSLYLNENSNSRTKQAEQAASFLKTEAERLSADIAELDARLAKFKSAHAESLPELTQLNQSGVERTDMELRDVENRLGTLDQQRHLIEAQLAQLNPSATLFADSGQRILTPEERLKAARSQLAGATARYSPDHPEVLAAQREVAGLEQQVSADTDVNDLNRRLDSLRGKLAADRERYSPEHPEVKRLEREIAGIESQIAVAPTIARHQPSKPDNPAYIQVKGQLDALLSERETLQHKQSDLRAKLGDYESRLANAPAVERDYRTLVRDSENARVKYQEVRNKQMEAEVSQNLETERKGERFTLIEPPLPPEQPISPKRGLILFMGLLLSLGLGLAAGWFAEC
jgi:polysaccharide biosynthesis transport protein